MNFVYTIISLNANYSQFKCVLTLTWKEYHYDEEDGQACDGIIRSM